MTNHQVARAQVITTQLSLGNINIIRTNPIVAAQKADAFVHYFQHTTAHLKTFSISQVLSDFYHQTVSL